MDSRDSVRKKVRQALFLFLMFIIAVLVTGGVGTAHAETGIIWTKATENAGFSARIDHTSVNFNGRMWVIGGVGKGGTYFDDVWYSTDGATWTNLPVSAPFPARSFHSSVVFDNKMWVIGGDSGDIDSPHYFNDVWYSTDGSTWTLATNDAEFSPRTYHTSVVFDNKMWVIGGTDIAGNYLNDVWYSTDGATWTLATNDAEFSPRTYHTSVVFDNKIWVIGGDDGSSIYLNDIWSSSDGMFWTRETDAAAFPVRIYHTSEVFDNKMWVIGGDNGPGNYYNDAWYSTDGVKWLQATASATQGQQMWEPRSYHSSVVFNNKMWVIGGDDGKGNYYNDVWYCTIKAPSLPVTIKIVPDTLNLGCHGGMFVVFVQLPKEYTANEVIKKSITCGGAPAERVIKTKCFPHTFAVIFNSNKLQNVPTGDKVTLILTGQLKHAGQELDFEGSDTVRIINKYTKYKGDIDNVLTLSDEKIFERHYKEGQFFNNKK